MKYTFVQCFDTTHTMSKECALDIAKKRAAEEFGKLLLENAIYEIHDDGTVRITVDI